MQEGVYSRDTTVHTIAYTEHDLVSWFVVVYTKM